MKAVLISTLILSVIVFSLVIFRGITIERACLGHLKRAADANTVSLASQELTTAITYLETNELTKGYTSCIYTTPDEDLEFWYNNLKDAQSELKKIDSTTSQMERTNVLMKLRETLLDNSTSGTKLTYPAGISRFPNNLVYSLFMGLCVTALVCVMVYYCKDSFIYD